LLFVIAYDISDERRRRDMVKLLEDYDGRRVNFSVFECEVEKKDFRFLKTKVQGIIDEKKDCVIYYALCQRCEKNGRDSDGIGLPLERKNFINI
jgi:CRISPR-associated protein Cas2